MRTLPEWQGEYGYFPLLTQREQLNDLVHKYAQINGCDYRGAWKALDKAWEKETGKTLSLFRALMQRETGEKITLPEYVMRAGLMERVLVVAHGMIGNVIIMWLNEHAGYGMCNQTAMENDRQDAPGRQDQLPFP